MHTVYIILEGVITPKEGLLRKDCAVGRDVFASRSDALNRASDLADLYVQNTVRISGNERRKLYVNDRSDRGMYRVIDEAANEFVYGFSVVARNLINQGESV